jgi:hypothetical protein
MHNTFKEAYLEWETEQKNSRRMITRTYRVRGLDHNNFKLLGLKDIGSTAYRGTSWEHYYIGIIRSTNVAILVNGEHIVISEYC